MCIQGLHSRQLAWCATDVDNFSNDYLRSILRYQLCVIYVNPGVALSGPGGILHSNDRHISRGLPLCCNCKCNIKLTADSNS